jgi:hypothetical protein
MANIHEIDLTMQDIEAHPERHRQAWWATKKTTPDGTSCGTAMCAAGFTVARHGYKFLFEHGLLTGTHRMTHLCESPDGEIELISAAAQRILDLDNYQTEMFFAASNTLSDLRRLRDQLVDGTLTESEDFAHGCDCGCSS